MNFKSMIEIFRGDDSDALGYQTIVGTIHTDLDLSGCKAVFRYLGFFQEFDPIPEDGKITIVIPSASSKTFPPGLGYASLRIYDVDRKVRTFTNRIPVLVSTMTPSCGCGKFDIRFSPFPELEPLKIFIGPNADDFDQYTGFISKIIDRSSLEKYGLAMLVDEMGEDGGESGKAASPLAVKAAYDAIIKELTDNYYTAAQTDAAINSVTAYYITRTADGKAFDTKAQLNSTTVFYSGGKVRIPTRNDYCVVLEDETHDNAEYRYIYAVAEGATTGSWEAQYPVGGVMTIDQAVTKSSANPVTSSGIWSALWGALAALPTGFTSLYDWVVSQLAGKASKSDATLADAATWACNPATDSNGEAYHVEWQDRGWATAWFLYAGDDQNPVSASYSTDASATRIEFTVSSGSVVATRAASQGLQLGNDDQHILASEAEAEALRTGKLDKSGSFFTLSLTDNGFRIADAAGVYYVEIAPNAISTNFPDGTDHAIAFPSATNGVLALIQHLAPDYDASASHVYKVDDLRAYDSKLYRCVTAHTATSWVAANWALATVEDVLAALRTGKADVSAIPYSLGTPIVIDSESVQTDTTDPDNPITYAEVTLADRTANVVQVTAATALDELRITFPAATSGKVRDFGLRVEIGTGSASLAAPALVPIAPTGETIKLENNAAEIPALADGTATAKGVTLLYFSETASGVFIVKGEQVEEVA